MLNVCTHLIRGYRYFNITVWMTGSLVLTGYKCIYILIHTCSIRDVMAGGIVSWLLSGLRVDIPWPLIWYCVGILFDDGPVISYSSVYRITNPRVWDLGMTDLTSGPSIWIINALETSSINWRDTTLMRQFILIVTIEVVSQQYSLFSPV